MTRKIKVHNGGKEYVGVVDVASIVDEVGVVFHLNDKIYRAITKAHEEEVRKFLARKDLNKFFEAGLVQTSISTYSSDQYPLVLEHRKIPFISYYMEWSGQMLYDVAHMIIDLQTLLVESGYWLKDGHPWNVLFDYSKPVFIDFGSIAKLQEFPETWALEFLRFFVPKFVQYSTNSKLDYGQLVAGGKQHGIKWFLKETKAWLNRLTVPDIVTEWSSYNQRPKASPDLYAPKQKVTYDLLMEYKDQCETIVDMGANRGWYSQIAADMGYKAIAFDIDDFSVSLLYKNLQESPKKVLPLVMDFCNPTPEHGSTRPGYPPATERLSADISLSLALVHHLVFKSRLNFAQIAAAISSFTKKVAIVEFIPPDDVHVKNWMTPQYKGYTQSGFIQQMQKYFTLKEVRDSNPDPRKILVFEKK
jgi:hypothetical protein